MIIGNYALPYYGKQYVSQSLCCQRPEPYPWTLLLKSLRRTLGTLSVLIYNVYQNICSQTGKGDFYVLQWAALTIELWAREFFDKNPGKITA